MTDELGRLEDTHAQQGLGEMGFNVFKGALQAGASMLEAYLVTAAYFRGMIAGSTESGSDKDD